MREIAITNIHTNESTIIFGYDAANAFKRAKLNATEWHIDWIEYVD